MLRHGDISKNHASEFSGDISQKAAGPVKTLRMVAREDGWVGGGPGASDARGDRWTGFIVSRKFNPGFFHGKMLQSTAQTGIERSDMSERRTS